MPHLTPSGAVVHALAYFITSFFGFLAYTPKKKMIIVVLIIYSTFLELCQIYIPYRSFNTLDIAANMVGIILVMLLFSKKYNFKKSLKKEDCKR